MNEKRVMEDYIASGVTRLRHQHGYPIAFRMAAGIFHAVNTAIYGIGGVSVILGKDVLIQVAQDRGMGIQSSSSLGWSVVLMGAISIGIAIFNAWAAISLLTARQEGYWYVVLINLGSFLWMVFLATPSSLLQWVQLGISLGVALLLLLDPRIKAFYGRGALTESWWDEELRRRRLGETRS